MSTPECPFCQLDQNRTKLANGFCSAVEDGFPVSHGHMLVIPRRHIHSIFDLNLYEYEDVWAMVKEVREMLKKTHNPDGFNVGLNDGRHAGQTVEHAHVHVIPRYEGDMEEPRGGVRHLMPGKGYY
jgi:diadenosine tetraphosphate (Ap4A) HIT family hydrolase